MVILAGALLSGLLSASGLMAQEPQPAAARPEPAHREPARRELAHQEPAHQGPGRIVLVRRTEDTLADQRRFAQGLSASALVGTPVCMLTDAELTAIQIDLLARLPAAAVVCVGAPPQGLGERAVHHVAEPRELYGDCAEVVLVSVHAHDQLEAAVEAARLRLPLLVADTAITQRVERLGVERVHAFHNRARAFVPNGITVKREFGPIAARLAALRDDEAPYLAIANVGAARSYGTGTPLGAAALAAAHRGVLHLIHEKVVFDHARLRQRTPPDELADHPAETWLLGGFDLGASEILVAVPQVGSGAGVRGETPRWGDPIIDLDGDGVLEPDSEQVEVGTVHEIEGRDWSISLRLIGAVGTTKFHDAMREERAIRVAPAAETIADQLTRLYAEAGVIPRALLVAGDHREVPFDYVKDPVYADSMMHEQELASDNLYADPDRDGYLDIAVGRFVASSHVQSTALAARLATQPHWVSGPAKNPALVYPAWQEDEIELGLPMIFPSFEALLRGVAADLDHVDCECELLLREAGGLERAVAAMATAPLVVFAHHSGPDGWQFRLTREDGAWQSEQLVPPRHAGRAPGSHGVPVLAGAPLIVGAGCDSAGLDYEVTFGRSIVHSFFEQGALGYVGNTRAGFPDTEEFLLRQLLQGMLGLAPGTAGPMTVGAAFRHAKNYLDLLIRERGPFRCVEPFENYALAMRREWTSLVYYGDPMLTLRLPGERAQGPTVAVDIDTDGGTIALASEAVLRPAPMWFMEEVGKGPLHEVDALVAPGLTYSSVPWALFGDTRVPAIVGPGAYLDLPLAGATVTVADGPEWALGGCRFVTDARGESRLLLSVDLARYAIAAPDDVEVARRIVLRLTR